VVVGRGHGAGGSYQLCVRYMTATCATETAVANADCHRRTQPNRSSVQGGGTALARRVRGATPARAIAPHSAPSCCC